MKRTTVNSGQWTGMFESANNNTVLKVCRTGLSLFLALSTSVYSSALPVINTRTDNVTVDESVPGEMTITAGDRAILNCESFDIGSSETVAFVQPSSSSVALSRVTGGSASSINGSLLANGRIFLVNPNGVFIGGSGIVNAAGFVASSLAISDGDFTSGNYNFTGGSTAGGVRNDGHINVGQGGYVGLIGRQVVNNGTIDCGYGRVALASGDGVSVDFEGDGLMSFAVNGQLADALVRNAGSIHAGGGEIVMAASAAADIAGGVVNNSGVIEAMSVEGAGGHIRLVASGAGVVNDGEITTAGRNGAQGGTVEIAAESFSNNGTISVAGNEEAPGGTLRINAGTVDGSGEVIADTIVEGEEISGTDESAAGGADSGSGTNETTESNEVVAEATASTGTDEITSSGDIIIYGGINAEGGKIILNAEGDIVLDGVIKADELTENGASCTLGGDVDIKEINASNEDGAITLTTGTLTDTHISDTENIEVEAGAEVTLAGDTLLEADSNQDGTGAILMHSGSAISGAGYNLEMRASQASTIDTINGVNKLSLGTSAGSAQYTQQGDISVQSFELGENTGLNSDASAHAFSSPDDFNVSAAGATFKRFAGGDGSEANPYQVGDLYGLQGIDSGSGELLDKHYQQNNNIDASVAVSWNNGEGFNPIGWTGRDGNAAFSGTYNGQNNEIISLTISCASVNVGLFGYASGAVVSNIILSNADIWGHGNVGAVVGKGQDGTIENCVVSGTIGGNSSTGGVIGLSMNNSVSNCQVSADVSGGFINTGGVVGYSEQDTVTDCSYNGAVNGESINVGGLIGYAVDSLIVSCNAQGTVDGAAGYVGGLIGFLGYGGRVENSAANVDVDSESSRVGGLVGALVCASVASSSADCIITGAQWVGGLAGQVYDSVISGSTAVCNVFGTVGVGGIAGDVYNSTISGTSSDSDVTGLGENSYYIGGGAGKLTSGTIDSSSVAGIIHGADEVGGMAGYANNSTISNSRATVYVTGNRDVGSVAGDLYMSSVDNCEVDSTVEGGDRTGGVAGRSGGSSISNSTVLVTLSGNDYTGGVVGLADDTSVGSTSVAGTVTGESNVGGVVGKGNEVIINDSHVDADVTAAEGRVGGVVGVLDTQSDITDSSVSGTVTGADSRVGGLIGELISSGTPANVTDITNCSVTAAVNGASNVGGLIGYADYGTGTISDSSFAGFVAGANYVGGLVGYAVYGVGINNSSVQGQVTGSGDYVGGLVGYTRDWTGRSINTTSFEGDVSGNDYVGGFIGYADDPVKLFDRVIITADDCQVSGNITGNNYVGGVVGYARAVTSISDSSADVQVSGADHVGGLIGHVIYETDINNASVQGQVSGADSVGGLIGNSQRNVAVTIMNSGFDGDVSGDSEVGGLVGYGKKISINNSHVEGNVTATAGRVGGIIGVMETESDIADSSFSGTVTGHDRYIGGLVGELAGDGTSTGVTDITNNSVTGTINGDNYYVGGLIGYIHIQSGASSVPDYQGTINIADCTFSGDAYGWASLGGIAGSVEDDIIGRSTSIARCSADGLVSATYGTTGGLVGYSFCNSISDSYFTGLVEAHDHWVGGLIGSLRHGTLTNSYAEVEQVSGVDHVGGLIGESRSSSISNCYAEIENGVTGVNSVGGLVGWSVQSDVSGSYAVADVSGTNGVGGIAGQSTHLTVSDSSFEGTVSGRNSVGGGIGGSYISQMDNVYVQGTVCATENTVGGMAGFLGYGSSIDNSVFVGSVSGLDNVGGLAGYAYTAIDINTSYADAQVSGRDNVGGLVGYAKYTVDIADSFADGLVSGRNNTGGLVGQIDGASEPSTVTRSYSYSSVLGTGENTGGFIGLNNGGQIAQCFSAGAIGGAANTGGFVGLDNGGSYAQSYWNTQTSLLDNASGSGAVSGVTGLNWDEMADSASFVGWNFGSKDDDWTMLRNMPFSTAFYSTDISSVYQLQLMNLDLTAHYVLTRDIDASSTMYWGPVWATYKLEGDVLVNRILQYRGGFDPIGGTTAFTGTFDGDGHSINYLCIQTEVSDVVTVDMNENRVDVFGVSNAYGYENTGLFGATSGANISNVNLSGVSVNGCKYTGALVGSAVDTDISNVSVSGTVHGSDYTGGLVGLSDGGSIVDVLLTSLRIKAEELLYADNSRVGWGDYTGGVVGYADSTAVDRINFVSAVINGGSMVGGLIGEAVNLAATLSDSSLVGVSVSGWQMVGGIIGHAVASTLENILYDDGYVYSNANDDNFLAGSANAGGLVGFMEGGAVTNAQAYTTVKARNDNVGGIVGHAVGAEFEDIYFSGDIIAERNSAYISCAGGFGGVLEDSTVSDAHVEASVTADGYDVGGFAGRVIGGADTDVDIENSTACGDVSGRGRVAGFAGHINDGAIIDNCQVEYGSSVYGAEWNNGGFAGLSTDGSLIKNSLVRQADVTSDGSHVGGFIGENTGSSRIENCGVSSGNVFSTDADASGVGGFAGKNEAGSGIEKSYTYADINLAGTNNTARGGFVGINDGSIKYSFVSNRFYLNGAELTGTNLVGGFLGQMSDWANMAVRFASNFWNSDNGLSSWNGDEHSSNLAYAPYFVNKTSAQMTNTATFSSFLDFSTDWIMSWNGPRLAKEWTSVIKTLLDLQLMSANLLADYVLANDIDASASASWNFDKGFSPIDNFEGTLDGQGHSISGLVINRINEDNVGLFGHLIGAEISDLVLVGAGVSGRNNVAVLAGSVDSSTVENVNISDAVVIAAGADAGALAGICGNSTVNGVNVGADVISYGWNAGGIIGELNNGASLVDGTFSGSVSGVGSVGGAVGLLADSFVNSVDVDAFSAVSGTSYNVGGFVGKSEGASLISDCLVRGGVSVTGTSDNVGGFVGENTGTSVIANCGVSGGTVSAAGANAQAIGGFAGKNDAGSVIEDSYTYADIHLVDTANTVRGGFVGKNEGSIRNSFVSNSFYLNGAELTGTNVVGGFLGQMNDWANMAVRFANNFWNSDNGLTAWDGGGANNLAYAPYFVNKTGAQMADASTFDPCGYDFVNDWIMVGDSLRLRLEWSERIRNVIELQLMALNASANYSVMNNIDASGTVNWNNGEGFAPIDNFSGTFDGQGYTISGLYINRPTENWVGLFARLFGAEIKNVSLDSVDIRGRDRVGAVAGRAAAGMENILSDISVSGTVTGSNSVGGIMGDSEYGASNTFNNCSVTGTVSGFGLVGGLLGDGGYGLGVQEFYDCSFSGNVVGTVGDWDGGIAGRVGTDSVLEKCFATGSVTGLDRVGGLVGFVNSGTRIEDCFVYDMTVSGTDRVGGLVGLMADASSITCSFAVADVNSDACAGGLIGSNEGGSVEYCYSVGTVSGTGDVGAFVGRDAGGEYESCVFDTTVSGMTDACGNADLSENVKGYTTQEIIDDPETVFAGWESEDEANSLDFLWIPNQSNFKNRSLLFEALFPGLEYVDEILLDGYSHNKEILDMFGFYYGDWESKLWRYNGTEWVRAAVPGRDPLLSINEQFDALVDYIFTYTLTDNPEEGVTDHGLYGVAGVTSLSIGIGETGAWGPEAAEYYEAFMRWAEQYGMESLYLFDVNKENYDMERNFIIDAGSIAAVVDALKDGSYSPAMNVFSARPELGTSGDTAAGLTNTCNVYSGIYDANDSQDGCFIFMPWYQNSDTPDADQFKLVFPTEMADAAAAEGKDLIIKIEPWNYTNKSGEHKGEDDEVLWRYNTEDDMAAFIDIGSEEFLTSDDPDIAAYREQWIQFVKDAEAWMEANNKQVKISIGHEFSLSAENWAKNEENPLDVANDAWYPWQVSYTFYENDRNTYDDDVIVFDAVNGVGKDEIFKQMYVNLNQLADIANGGAGIVVDENYIYPVFDWAQGLGGVAKPEPETMALGGTVSFVSAASGTGDGEDLVSAGAQLSRAAVLMPVSGQTVSSGSVSVPSVPTAGQQINPIVPTEEMIMLNSGFVSPNSGFELINFGSFEDVPLAYQAPESEGGRDSDEDVLLACADTSGEQVA